MDCEYNRDGFDPKMLYPGFVGSFDNVCFEELIRALGPANRVSIASWDKCAGGSQ